MIIPSQPCAIPWQHVPYDFMQMVARFYPCQYVPRQPVVTAVSSPDGDSAVITQ